MFFLLTSLFPSCAVDVDGILTWEAEDAGGRIEEETVRAKFLFAYTIDTLDVTVMGIGDNIG